MENGPADRKQSNHWKILSLLVVLAAVIFLFRWLGWSDKLTDLRNWIGALGAWGPVVFIFLYIVAVIAALPGAAITIAAGTLFGSVLGVIVVSIASTIGAGLAFLIARYLARDFIRNKFAANVTFRKLDDLTREHGAIVVAITRLIPLFPFDLLNYGFGLTGIHFRTYLFWSWLCMLPGTILYVVGTDVVVSAIASGKIPWLLLLVLVIAGIVLALLIRLAKKKMSKEGINKE